MEDKELIRRSPYGLYVQIIGLVLFALAVGVLATWLFRTLLGWTEGGGARLIGWTWLLFLIVGVFASLKLWLDWRVKRYEIGPDMLVVHAKGGRFGSSQTVYRYESIISLRMRQSMLGKMFGYGDILLTIPKIDYEIVMNDIEEPDKQIAEIQRHLSSSSDRASSYIN